MPLWPALLVILSGLYGACGIAAAAASAHTGGANLETASRFLLLHGIAILALALAAPKTPFLIAATVLAIGTALFAGDLAVRTLGAARLFPMAAPAGGVLMITGWVGVAIAGVLALASRS